MRLLMSLCNVGHFNSQFSLAVADTGGGEPLLVDCGEFLDPTHEVGVAGLCRIPGGIAMAVQSPSHSRIVLLDDKWKLIKAIGDERFADVHSLYERDGFLFCLCSGTNKVLKIGLKDHAVSLFWEYHLDEPFLHINSLIFHEGRPLVTSHKTAPEGPGEARSGGAWYLDDYSVLIDGLDQPHTLVEHEGAVYCLSSPDSRVMKWRDGKVTETVAPNYLRGLAFDGAKAVVGSSSRRFVSRKQPGVRHYTDFTDVVGNEQYMSSLLVCDRDFNVEARIDTTSLGFEIYDIVPDPGAPEGLLVEDAASVRMQTMQRQILGLRDRVQTLKEGRAQ